MTDASTTGAVERLAQHYDERVEMHDSLVSGVLGNLRQERGKETRDFHKATADTLRALVAERDAAIQRAEAAYAKGFAAIRALRRAAPTEGEAHSLDDTTQAVLDRAERIVAGQSQQEQRTAEIFLRPTEGEA